MIHADLSRLRHPRHVAIVGASDRPGSLGAVATRNLLEHSSFGGLVSLVNPNQSKVHGRPTISDIASLPRVPDVALVAVPRTTVPNVVADLAAIGTPFAVVISGGFAEADQRGAELQRDLVAAAAGTETRVVGPNTPGVADFGSPLGLTIQPGFSDERLSGHLGLIAQSGGLTRSILQWMHRHVGFSAFFSPGNQADLQIADYLAHLVRDGVTRSIAIVAESIGDAERFEHAAEMAGSAGIPITMLKVGQSTAGRRAASSHTGSLVGSAAATRAVAERVGITLVDELDQLVLTAAWQGRTCGRRRVSDRGVGVYGLSGGAGVLLADALGSRDIPLAELSAETRARLEDVTAPGSTISNPVDVGGPGLSDPTAYERGLRALSEEAGVAVVLVGLNAWYEALTDRFVSAILSVSRTSDVPIVPVWLSPRFGPERARLEAEGSLCADNLAAAVRLTRTLLQPVGAVAPTTRAKVASAERLRHRWNTWTGDAVTEIAVKKSLRDADIAVPAEEVVTDLAETRTAALRLGYPVILKAVTPSVTHRAGTGLVSGRIDDDDQLQAAWHTVTSAANASLPENPPVLLLAHYIVDGVEAHVGLATDDEWGAVVSVGLGGQLVEVLADSQLIAPGASAETIHAALAGSRIADAYRHRHPRGTALDELARLVVLIAHVAERPCPVLELDLNPVVLDARSAWVVDGLAIPAPPALEGAQSWDPR